MGTRTAKLTLVTILMFGAPAVAQEAVIDVFEGQSEMKSTVVRVESTDGSPIIESGSGDDDSDYGGDPEGGFTLRYEKRQSSILVPATVEGHAVYFIFDTGATYTTIDAGFAAKAGVTPKEGSPVGQSRTANGIVATRYGILSSLVLGGRNHGGVTFGMCANCPSGMHKGKPIVGLLGMNVIGRYRTSFDHSKGVIEMTPSSNYADRAADVDLWMDVEYKSFLLDRNGKDFVAHGVVRNRGRRTIRQVTVEFTCEGGTPATSTISVGAYATAKFRVVIKDGNCRAGTERSVINARW